MARTKLKDIPTKENTISEPKQVVVKPLFAKPNALASIFGISYSSTNRILKEWEKDPKGVDDLYYSLSSTMTVISIPRFEEYMKKRHKMDVGGKAMKMYLTYICLVSLLTILLLAISNMYVAFSVYGMMVTYGFNLTGGLENE